MGRRVISRAEGKVYSMTRRMKGRVRSRMEGMVILRVQGWYKMRCILGSCTKNNNSL